MRQSRDNFSVGMKIPENYGFFVIVIGSQCKNNWRILKASRLHPARSGQSCFHCWRV